MTGRRPPPVFAWGELWPLMGAKAAAFSMFAVFLLTDLAAGWLHVVGLTGFGFAAGSAVAAGRTRRHDLLLATTTPPLIFLAAVISGELITLHVSHVAASPGLVIANIFLTLTSSAPWLFGGVAGALVIAMVRGLPSCVRELRAELAGRLPRAELGARRPGTARWPQGAVAGRPAPGQQGPGQRRVTGQQPGRERSR